MTGAWVHGRFAFPRKPQQQTSSGLVRKGKKREKCLFKSLPPRPKACATATVFFSPNSRQPSPVSDSMRPRPYATWKRRRLSHFFASTRISELSEIAPERGIGSRACEEAAAGAECQPLCATRTTPSTGQGCLSPGMPELEMSAPPASYHFRRSLMPRAAAVYGLRGTLEV
jgi:hypothetical protein